MRPMRREARREARPEARPAGDAPGGVLTRSPTRATRHRAEGPEGVVRAAILSSPVWPDMAAALARPDARGVASPAS